MDIRSIGAYYSNQYYNNSMKNNSTLAFKSHGWPDTQAKLRRRIAADAQGFNSANIMLNELSDIDVSSENGKKIASLFDMMLGIIRDAQAENKVLFDRYTQTKHKNNRLNNKRTRYHQYRYDDQRRTRT